MQTLSRAFACAVLLTVLPSVPFAADFPKHTGYVNDFSNVLSPEVRTYLEELLRTTEAETTAEIALAVVPSLDGMTVEEYANRLFQEWGIGKEKVDNGVLVVVAPNEREMRIEVGYGLEPVLPDGLAGEIIRTDFLPHFRDNNYAAGIHEGLTRIAEVVKRNHVLTAEERQALEESGGDAAPWFVTIPFLGLFIVIGFFMFGAGFGSKTGFPVLFGSLFGGMPLLMSMIPGFGAPIYVMGPLAVGAAVMGFRNGRRSPVWIKSMRATGGKGGGGRSSGWVMGGGSSSGGSSSRSSGGGSFGGGSSGGGGASGRW
jgi:uncharacterized protein